MLKKASVRFMLLSVMYGIYAVIKLVSTLRGYAMHTLPFDSLKSGVDIVEIAILLLTCIIWFVASRFIKATEDENENNFEE